jgi:hypothetical protein
MASPHIFQGALGFLCSPNSAVGSGARRCICDLGWGIKTAVKSPLHKAMRLLRFLGQRVREIEYHASHQSIYSQNPPQV